MPVGDGIEDGPAQKLAEELDLLLVAGGAEPAALAGERQDIFVLAVIAADPGEPPGQVPALRQAQELRHSRNFLTTSGMTGRR